MKKSELRVGWFFACCMVSVSALSAQQVIVGNNPGGQPAELTFMNFFGPEGEGSTYGSPYLFNEWKDGYVIMAAGDTVSDIDLAFDLYEQQLVIGNSWMAPTRLDIETVASFVFEDVTDKTIFVRRTLAEEGQQGYLQVLHVAGAYEVLARKAKYIKKGNEYDSSRLYHEYRDRRPAYYLVFPGSTIAHKVPGSRKALYELLEEQTPEAKRFLKENKLRSKDPENLKALIDFLSGQSES